MANSWFRFQQFEVNQANCAMKISTDAVLLGALASYDSPSYILDIGTGTGVIALMLAQRFPSAKIEAVEIDGGAGSQAKENFKQSPFSDRLDLCISKIQEYTPSHKFELIVSNPPYFSDHLKSLDVKRKQALHTDELSFAELIASVDCLLTLEGLFWLILPPRQMQDFIQEAERNQLFLQQKFTVQDRHEKKILREICSFSRKNSHPKESEIFIKNDDGSPHTSYAKLAKGFLLNF